MIQRFAMSLRACGKLDCERVLGRARSSPKLIHLPKAVGRRKVGANADSDAEADEELEHGPMPLMPGYLLHSLAFIYTTEHRSFHMDYIVTAYHVIRGLKHVTLRFNLKNGGVHIVKNIPLKEWMAN